MWNDYIWANYKQAGGKVTIKMFERNLSNFITKNYPAQIRTLQETYVADANVREDIYEQLNETLIFEEAYINTPSDIEISPNEELSTIDDRFSDSCDFFWRTFMMEDESPTEIDYKVFFDYFCGNLAHITTLLSLDLSELFIPYYFSTTYNILETIANIFEIDFPAIPAKSDYKGRVWHYANICKALYTFRIKNNLTFYELCAFLYDFAPKYVGGIDSKEKHQKRQAIEGRKGTSPRICKIA